MTNESPDELRLRIQQELVASGQYQEIFNILKLELANSGWFEQFRELTDTTVSDKGKNGEEIRFTALVSQLESQGMAMVSDNVKLKVLKRIKQFLDEVVE